jgi:hypothetical protein
MADLHDSSQQKAPAKPGKSLRRAENRVSHPPRQPRYPDGAASTSAHNIAPQVTKSNGRRSRLRAVQVRADASVKAATELGYSAANKGRRTQWRSMHRAAA